jgi:hypothetical protein
MSLREVYTNIGEGIIMIGARGEILWRVEVVHGNRQENFGQVNSVTGTVLQSFLAVDWFIWRQNDSHQF